MVASDAFSGVVLVARAGAPVYEKALGLADRDRKTPNTVETRFSIGSINKIFTKTAIAQLVAQGRLKLSDTLGALLPDYPQAATKAATVDQLLSHQGGVADFFGPAFDQAPKDRFRSNADYYQLVATQAPLFAPGAQRQVLQRLLHRARRDHREGVRRALRGLHRRARLHARRHVDGGANRRAARQWDTRGGRLVATGRFGATPTCTACRAARPEAVTPRRATC